MKPYDVVVVGAGFGGLGAALHLAESGARVLVLEALTYPGGCAGTFSRAGYRFDAGATLVSGLAPGQLFARWAERHGLDIRPEPLDPVVELRAPGFTLPVPASRDALLQQLLALPDAPRAGLTSFFALQRSVADALWDVLDDPRLLPPFGLPALMQHAVRLPRYLPLVRWAGRPAIDVLRAHGVEEFAPLRTFVDALCQITVQCGVAEAEAPFALAALDYYFRGAAHLRGGVGTLADALVQALRGLGADVRFGERVRSVEAGAVGAGGSPWFVETPRGTYAAAAVCANLLPQNIARLLGPEAAALPELAERASEVEGGWGACMLYRALTSPSLNGAARHVEIVQDPAAPLVEGNHLFCSLGAVGDGAAGDGGDENVQTLTVSTHVSVQRLRELGETDRAAYVADIHERMRAGLARFAPELCEGVLHEMTASPRTFERFTGRADGLVGGVPRRHGVHNYRRLGPCSPAPGLYLVGDSVFPGQSALAAATGGVCAGEALLRSGLLEQRAERGRPTVTGAAR